MAIPIKVAVYRGTEFVGEHRFDREIIKIGRLASAHLKLDDPKVSRIHAVIEVSTDGQELAIIDMGSSDGTYVNGERISKERLKDGDEVRVGDCRIVVALDDGKSAAVAPAAAPIAAAPVEAAWAVQENIPTGMYSAAMPGAPVPQGAAGGWTGGPVGPGPGWGAPPPQAQSWTAAPPAQAAWPASPAGVGLPGGWPAPGMSAEDARAAQFAPTGQWQLSPNGGGWADPQQQQAMYAAQAMAAGYPGYGVPADAQATGQMAPLFPTPDVAYPSGIPNSPEAYQAALAQAYYAQAGYGQPGQDVAMPGYPVFAVNAAWGSAPNNLAGEGVPDTDRDLEIKTIWADSVLDTINVFDKPLITMGDEAKYEGAFIFARVVLCDVEVPSKDLPAKRFPLAACTSKGACNYAITFHSSMSGHIERQDGVLVSLQELVAGGVGIEQGNLHDTFVYTLQPAETVYIKHGMLTLQLRYVRRQKFIPPPLLDRLNYTWLNTLILVLFFQALAVASFLAQPTRSETLEDSLYKNRNRFANTLLTPEQKKKQKDDTLAKLKAGQTGAKANKAEGAAGRKDLKDVKNPGRMAVKGDPNDKEIAKSTMQRLFGGGEKGQSYLFGTGGLGGELKGALGGVSGAQVGDAAGLGGLGTRGAGPGGGGLAMNSVGLGALGTSGRGGGGEGSDYGSGVGGLGKKTDRDINISAGQPVIMGSLDKELIRRVIEAHKAQIRYCYEKELVRSPGLFGKVEMEWTIGADGLVKDSKPKTSTMNNAEVERCIAGKIRTWEFPKPKGGGIVLVRYPFVLKTSG